MPRITKAEVRASIAEAKKKAVSKKSKEELLREQKNREKQPYPAITTGTGADSSNKKLVDRGDANKTNIEASPVKDENNNKAITKKVNISNFDPTLVAPNVTRTEIVAINRAEIEEARKEMSKVEEENIELTQKLEASEEKNTNLLNEIREITLDKDTIQDSYEKKLSEEKEKYNKMLLEKNSEISDLRAELLTSQKALEQKETEPEKKGLISNKAQKIIAYLFYITFSASILGLIIMLVAKGLMALGSWLF